MLLSQTCTGAAPHVIAARDFHEWMDFQKRIGVSSLNQPNRPP